MAELPMKHLFVLRGCQSYLNLPATKEHESQPSSLPDLWVSSECKTCTNEQTKKIQKIGCFQRMEYMTWPSLRAHQSLLLCQKIEPAALSLLFLVSVQAEQCRSAVTAQASYHGLSFIHPACLPLASMCNAVDASHILQAIQEEHGWPDS